MRAKIERMINWQNASRIAILGAGSWGSTLAWLFSSHGREVSVWVRETERVSLIKSHRHPRGGATVPTLVRITSDMSEAIADAEVVLFCCTSQSMREVAEKFLTAWQAVENSKAAKPILVTCAKGFELPSLKRMSEILQECLPGFAVAALSGPNLAGEIAGGLPTATVVACDNQQAATAVQTALSVASFRVYTNDDVIGVELGGALKNIFAVASGCVDGLGLGTNAKATLLTRGLVEMVRVSSKLGAKPATLTGLAGMGDLFATCSSELSRNYRLGKQISQGSSIADAIDNLGGVAEGVWTAEAVCEMSKNLGIDLPIVEQINATLKGTTTPEHAIMKLMTRPLSSEY